MIPDFLLHFFIEVTRALLVEELSGHVRKILAVLISDRGARNIQNIRLHVHRRNRERLLNRLLTDPSVEL